MRGGICLQMDTEREMLAVMVPGAGLGETLAVLHFGGVGGGSAQRFPVTEQGAMAVHENTVSSISTSRILYTEGGRALEQLLESGDIPKAVSPA